MATNSQSITKNEPVSPLSSRSKSTKFVRAARVFGMDPAQKEKSIGSVAVNSGKYQKHTASNIFCADQSTKFQISLLPQNATKICVGIRNDVAKCQLLDPQHVPLNWFLWSHSVVNFVSVPSWCGMGPVTATTMAPNSQIRICHPHRNNHRKSPKVTSLVKRLNDQLNNTHHSVDCWRGSASVNL